VTDRQTDRQTNGQSNTITPRSYTMPHGYKSAQIIAQEHLIAILRAWLSKQQR